MKKNWVLLFIVTFFTMSLGGCNSNNKAKNMIRDTYLNADSAHQVSMLTRWKSETSFIDQVQAYKEHNHTNYAKNYFTQINKSEGTTRPPQDLYNIVYKTLNNLIQNSPFPDFKVKVNISGCYEFTFEATEGQGISICRGAFRYVQNIDTLAFFLAHELSHHFFAHGNLDAHTRQKVQPANDKIDDATEIGALATVISSGGMAIPVLAGISLLQSSSKDGLFHGTRSRISQEDEDKADLLAIDLLVSAGYNPNAVFSVFPLLQQAYLHKKQQLELDAQNSYWKYYAEKERNPFYLINHYLEKNTKNTSNNMRHASPEERQKLLAAYINKFYRQSTIRPIQPLTKSQDVKNYLKGLRLFEEALYYFECMRNITEAVIRKKYDEKYCEHNVSKKNIVATFKRSYEDMQKALFLGFKTDNLFMRMYFLQHLYVPEIPRRREAYEIIRELEKYDIATLGTHFYAVLQYVKIDDKAFSKEILHEVVNRIDKKSYYSVMLAELFLHVGDSGKSQYFESLCKQKYHKENPEYTTENLETLCDAKQKWKSRVSRAYGNMDKAFEKLVYEASKFY